MIIEIDEKDLFGFTEWVSQNFYKTRDNWIPKHSNHLIQNRAHTIKELYEIYTNK